ncbi:hypothetical protein GCM10023063_19750 [Arthrobacter methylotrophus]|uniref:Acid stress chaperone HdeA n=1 Tax=Arthrobacter methylotrophus TaxID=121291 RepID=A0ABV5URL1_9MICC
MKKLISVAAAGLVLLSALTGCGASGGNTTCKDFRASDSSKQTETITQILKDKGDSKPSPLKVSAYKLTAKGFCEVKSPDTKLSEMSGS